MTLALRGIVQRARARANTSRRYVMHLYNVSPRARSPLLCSTPRALSAVSLSQTHGPASTMGLRGGGRDGRRQSPNAPLLAYCARRAAQGGARGRGYGVRREVRPGCSPVQVRCSAPAAGTVRCLTARHSCSVMGGSQELMRVRCGRPPFAHALICARALSCAAQRDGSCAGG